MIEDILPQNEQPYKIPDNWHWTTWGKCGKFIAGTGFNSDYQGFTEYNIPFYKVSSLKFSDSNGYIRDKANTVNGKLQPD